jgi:hypothetical protein
VPCRNLRDSQTKGGIMGLEKFDSFVKTQLIEMVNGIYTDKDLINMMKKTVETYEKFEEE